MQVCKDNKVIKRKISLLLRANIVWGHECHINKSWCNYEYMNNKCVIIKNEYYERTDFVFCDCSV